MKFCEDCGNKIEKNEKFCSKCGKKQTASKTKKEEQVKEEKNDQVKSEEVKQVVNNVPSKDSPAGLILGVIAIVLALTMFFSPIALILAIIGLVLSLKIKVKSGNKTAGIVLNTVALILTIIMFFAFIVLIGVFAALDNVSQNGGIDYIEEAIENNITAPSPEEIAATWDCKQISTIGTSESATLTITKDYTFTFGKTEDIANNYVKGIYEIDYDSYTNNYGYALELDGKEVVENGQKNIHRDIDYDFVVTKYSSSLKGVLTDDDNSKVYYCYVK